MLRSFRILELMEPIVISGASGFLGSAFLARLLKRPDVEKVLILSRRKLDPSDRYLARQFASKADSDALWKKVEIISCDLADTTSRRQGLKEVAEKITGKVILCHLAAQISEKGDPSFIRELNVIATRDLVDWANKYARSISFVSSVAAFGSTNGPRIRSEADFSEFETHNNESLYCMTKREAHLAVTEGARIPWHVVCPSVIHGAWDSMKDTRSRLKPYFSGKLSWAPPGGANFVALDHVLNVLEKGLGGLRDSDSRIELAVGANWTFKNYIEKYLAACGRPRRLRQIPLWVFRIIRSLASLKKGVGSSFVHGGRYLYFNSQFEQGAESSEAATINALESSAKTMSKDG